MEPKTHSTLTAAAIEARTRSYSPYSNFAVGAAVLCSDGLIFTGCNVENASYPLSICAERVAIANAVASNNRKPIAIAIAATPLAPPCGACRQVLAEFNSNMEVTSIDSTSGAFQSWKISELLPHQFQLPTETPEQQDH